MMYTIYYLFRSIMLTYMSYNMCTCIYSGTVTLPVKNTLPACHEAPGAGVSRWQSQRI